jgi:UDP:flavonoid glycosyltransferase YjiC (YdhE family)
MAAGIPMVALPLHIDQPLNANLAAELGAAAVRITLKGKEGEAARRRARELQEVVARNDGDDAQITTLLQRMARLCSKGQAVPN